MTRQDVIGELLYIGFVAEKGRCYGQRWKIGYKKTVKKHIHMLYRLSDLMCNDREDINLVMIDFVKLCDNSTAIGKFYPIADSIKTQIYSQGVNWEEGGYNYNNIDKLIQVLMDDLLQSINKFKVNKKEVYNIFRVLHNLPRVYLGDEKQTFCNLNQRKISEHDAMEFARLNMEGRYKERYSQYT